MNQRVREFFALPPQASREPASREDRSTSSLIDALYMFMLAGFIGFEVIRRVSPLLHTPLMSLTNALDAIAVVGAIVLVGKHESTFCRPCSARSRSSPPPATSSADS